MVMVLFILSKQAEASMDASSCVIKVRVVQVVAVRLVPVVVLRMYVVGQKPFVVVIGTLFLVVVVVNSETVMRVVEPLGPG